MAEVWFAIVALMFTLYVVLDGFDLGAGALQRWVARDDAERRQVIQAIGPYWDANEVWLLAGGGALFVAFPRALASGLSGFYLAIFLVLWLLIVRGIAIECRHHFAEPLFRSFSDTAFGIASALLATFFGVALGNILRGLPLRADGWFELSLFTDLSAHPPVGILDWYTVLVGGFALAALMMHGAVFLAWKTSGEVERRSRSLASRFCVAVAVLWPLMTLLTVEVNPELFARFVRRPQAWLAVIVALAGLTGAILSLSREKPRVAFLGSSAFLAGLLVATATSLFPDLLPSIEKGSLSLTAYNSGADPRGLHVALRWWLAGFPLAIGYFWLLFKLHRGKNRSAIYAEHS